MPKPTIKPHGSTEANGAPAASDRNSLTASPDGPILLHDFHLLDTLAHFNRENVPERKPHAKGSGAFGTWKVTGDVTKYTKAALFQPGASCRMLARFSTVAGELGSPDTWRDVRGFALKFYTEQGNYDMVGNNTPVFFLRDPMKFPHFIRSQKRLPDSGLRDVDMQWDFWTLNPESAHQVTYLMGDRGLPKTWRTMNGYSSHTYQWINEAGERFWVKYHFHSQQGVENMEAAEAAKVAGADSDFHRRDLFEAIQRGEYPRWKLSVQVMGYEEAKTYRYNPFDLTKVWPHADFPLIEVGEFELNENPTNHFAQIEQAAFSPSNLVPGIGFSPDKMLLGRVFAYPDAHRARIGTNFHQLPVNRPVPEVDSYLFDGAMNFTQHDARATYAPNSKGHSYADTTGVMDNSWEVTGEMMRDAYTLRADDDDFTQPGLLVREVMDDDERARLVETVGGMMSECCDEVRERVFWYWRQIDENIGKRIEQFWKDGQEADPNPGGEADLAKQAAQKGANQEHNTNAVSK